MSQTLRVYQKCNCLKIPYGALFPFQHWLAAEVKWLRQFLISCCIFLSGQNRWGPAQSLLTCLTEGFLQPQLLKATGHWDSKTSPLLLLKWASLTLAVTRSLAGRDVVNPDILSIFFSRHLIFGPVLVTWSKSSSLPKESHAWKSLVAPKCGSAMGQCQVQRGNLAKIFGFCGVAKKSKCCIETFISPG